ncbi:hypothetical protein [Brevundimonas subvibrioides]|uniref:hypothetical protein n=1 Tax=Brevundimonas subvibrioides TaxID=74313 RepID=UPI0022B519CE|nr:hypothetical protein [Brevundimonas subvibrioides]
MTASFALATLLAGSAIQSAAVPPPWSGVHLLAAPGIETGTYSCDAGEVRIVIERPGFQGSPRVQSFTVDRVTASQEALQQLNGWLAEFAIYQSYSLSCRGPWIGVSIRGFSRGEGLARTIGLFWRGGQWWRDDPPTDQTHIAPSAEAPG